MRAGAGRFIRPLRPRDPLETARAASPLELLTDLCFVVAVAQASASLHHEIVEGHVGHGALHFAMAFFAIFWTWLNFTWFGSAYDNDDLLYRLLTILQILGALVLAAGIPRMFDDDFTLTVAGYVLMRVALVTQWVRASRSDPSRRTTGRRYALGVTVVQLGWVGYLWLPHDLGLPGFVVLVACDMAVPVWAESAERTTWHPHHVAERYSLFFIIVLGEAILSSTVAIQTSLDEGAAAGRLTALICGGVVLVFSLWWLYFSRDDAEVLLGRSNTANMTWGFGHYFVFSSAAALGAGLSVRVDYYTHHTDTSGFVTAGAITVPTAILVMAIYVFHLRQHDASPLTFGTIVAGLVVVLIGSFTPQPELVAGVSVAAMVALSVVRQARQPHPGRAVESTGRDEAGAG
jgi:low temperature requirement protein LtrA